MIKIDLVFKLLTQHKLQIYLSFFTSSIDGINLIQRKNRCNKLNSAKKLMCAGNIPVRGWIGSFETIDLYG